MPDIYSHNTVKFGDRGLMLRLPVDLVPPNAYSRFNNVVSEIEGQLETRPGIVEIAKGVSATGAPIVAIFRLNQQVPAVSSERIAVDGAGAIYSQQLPSGAFVALTGGPTYDGNPPMIVDFRFDADQSSWAIIANSSGMMKRRRPALYQLLGIAPPSAPATASAGGAGLLDSTGAPGYDWVYTYVNSIVNSESNPAPANIASGTQRPTANTNPDPTSGGSACLNPANAYDNNPATFAEFDGVAATTSSMSCKFQTWGAIPATTLPPTINVDYEVTTGGSTGYIIASIYYTTNNGASWATLVSTLVAQARTTVTATLPLGVDYTQLQLRAVAYGAPTSGGGGGGDTGGGGGSRCPLSGAPVHLYGEPEWWTKSVVPCEDFVEIITDTGRRGVFSPDDRRYCDKGLLHVKDWEAGLYAVVDDPAPAIELVVSVRRIHIAGATVDSYEANKGHVYSAWGFVGHNIKWNP